MGKMKALSQNGLYIHGSSGLLIKRISSTVRVWHDDFRDGDYYITGFQERSQTAGFSQILAIIIQCYVLYCYFLGIAAISPKEEICRSQPLPDGQSTSPDFTETARVVS